MLLATVSRKTNSSQKHSGQALVETAIVITILAVLFLAAVDLGLAYRSYQTLVNSTAEAASYLAQFPVDNTGSTSGSDAVARDRFRDEQDGTRSGSGTNAISDSDIKIDVADSDQITINSDDFALIDGSNFTPRSYCAARSRFDSAGRQCFIVVRTVTSYSPFFLSPALGNAMTIRAIAIKPIVGLP